MANTFGLCLKLTTWGESHGKAIGGVIDGFPAGFKIDIDYISSELERRSTAKNEVSSQRREPDIVRFLSGLMDNITTGAPIAFIIDNADAHSADYERMKSVFRPSHADYTYHMKYGIRDYRGGGRASARETAVRVVAGAMAKQWLKTKYGIVIDAYTSQLGNVVLPADYAYDCKSFKRWEMGAPDEATGISMKNLAVSYRNQGDSIGGIVTCHILNVRCGLGEPLYNKLQSALAAAMMSIPAAKGFDYGSGFSDVALPASQLNDEMTMDCGSIAFKTNHSGGIQGGISNGEDIYFRVVFKPIASIPQEQHTVTKAGVETVVSVTGRHDVSVIPRVLPVVESMAALVIMDAYLSDVNYIYAK